MYVEGTFRTCLAPLSVVWDIVEDGGQLTTVPHRLEGIQEIQVDVSDCFFTMSWNPAGSNLASTCFCDKVRIYSTTLENGAITMQQEALFHEYGTICCLSWHPNSTMLVGGSFNNNVYMWGKMYDSEWNHWKTFSGHTDRLRSVDWHPFGKFIASGSDDKTIRIWNSRAFPDSTSKCRILRGHVGFVFAVKWHCDGIQLASGSYDSEIRLWDTSTNPCVYLYSPGSYMWSALSRMASRWCPINQWVG